MKNLYFITGLPRSGTTLISSILKQNPQIHCNSSSSLASLINLVHKTWAFDQENNEELFLTKLHVLKSMLDGYYYNVDKPNIVDNDKSWISCIGLIEAILEQQIKIIVCVRNPADILTSYERSRKENPLIVSAADQELKNSSSIAGRAFYYSGPNGPLGLSHRQIQDAVIEGYLNRMLFVDYDRFCNSPRTQIKRIYEFFNLTNFEHNFENIDDLPRSKLQKITVNPVSYLGLDLFQQYNREIFWNAWV